MTADTTRQEVRFVRWDIPAKKQEDLPERVRKGEIGRMDKGHVVITALGETADRLWDAGGEISLLYTMQDNTDGEVRLWQCPTLDNPTVSVYDRKILIALLENMDSDYVKLSLKSDYPVIMYGTIGEKSAAAMIAPRIENDRDI